jgi:hypothetical protein
VGAWFVSSGFFAENESLGHPFVAWDQVREGVYRLSGPAVVWPAYAAAALVVWTFARSRARASLVLVLAFAAAAALPWYAYLEGHPFRIRYGVPLVVACAAIVGTGIGLLPRRLRAIAAGLAVAGALWQVTPLDRSAAVIAESQRDAANQAGRRAVTAYLRSHHDGRPIMMSMGSLAHYMHDLSREGFAVRDFLHEGNGDVWTAAMQLGPRAFVTWVAVEERAEGGDAVYQRGRPGFPEGSSARGRRRSSLPHAARPARLKAKCMVKLKVFLPRSIRLPSSSLSSGLVSPSAFCHLYSKPAVNASPTGMRSPATTTGPTAVPLALYCSRKIEPSENSTNSPDSV